jgi:hypothetical protein
MNFGRVQRSPVSVGINAMKKPALVLLIGALALVGCSSPYNVKLTNGTTITTASKPKLKDGVYYFKDADGSTNFIPAGRVREIQPASMAKQEQEQQRSQFTTQQTKPKHWYWPF